MLRVLLIALIAIGRELLEPGTNILFRSIVPLGVGLQSQVYAHLRVLLLTHRDRHLFTRTLAFVGGYSFDQFSVPVHFFVECLQVGSAIKRIASNAPARL